MDLNNLWPSIEVPRGIRKAIKNKMMSFFKHGSIYIRNEFPGNPEIVNWKIRGNGQVGSGKSCRADRLFPSTTAKQVAL